MIHCFPDSSSDEGENSDSNVSDKEMDSDKENDSTPQDSPDMTAVMQNLIQKGENSFFLFIFFFRKKLWL